MLAFKTWSLKWLSLLKTESNTKSIWFCTHYQGVKGYLSLWWVSDNWEMGSKCGSLLLCLCKMRRLWSLQPRRNRNEFKHISSSLWRTRLDQRKRKWVIGTYVWTFQEIIQYYCICKRFVDILKHLWRFLKIFWDSYKISGDYRDLKRFGKTPRNS